MKGLRITEEYIDIIKSNPDIYYEDYKGLWKGHQNLMPYTRGNLYPFIPTHFLPGRILKTLIE